MNAYFIDPVILSFLNPITNIKKYLYIHIDTKLSFNEKIRTVQQMSLEKLKDEINDAHNQLLVKQATESGFDFVNWLKE